MYDVVNCFFLLHEIPDELKRAVVDALLLCANRGGKVVFIDRHKPAKWRPLRGILRQLFKRLELYAKSLWHHEIVEFSSAPENYS
jgi:hypothetical protein